MRIAWSRWVLLAALAIASGGVGCAAQEDLGVEDDDGGGNDGMGGDSDNGFVGTGGDDGSLLEDPRTCEQAASSKAYVGCDFWPTITPNPELDGGFAFAVVVANTSEEAVDVQVDQGGMNVRAVTVPPQSLQTIELPWHDQLFNGTTSLIARAGAFHLTATRPVTVYQFNPLQYRNGGGDFSFTNDASLLLPSTAMTGTYRVMSSTGSISMYPSFVAITGTQAGTNVTLELAQNASAATGAEFGNTGRGGAVSATIERGDVMLLFASDISTDLSGSIVRADKPVQVIVGNPCTNIPVGRPACDHIEESVFPAETLGKRYVVSRPTGPYGVAVPHQVVIYGNFDGTVLTYTNGSPVGAPSRIDAGQVVTFPQVETDFVVEGSEPFGVGSFELASDVIDPGTPPPDQQGDPAQSFATATEQYRTRYVFLAPTDYASNFADVVRPRSAGLLLNGAPVAGERTELGEYVVERIPLPSTTGGQHVLESLQPFGLQVTGYGSYTSYYYPGGLNLQLISAPPD
ncbi:MAG: hypothetical protein AAGA56_18060 [Myxococcota bacterium]